MCVCLVAQSCLTLCDPMDCSPPGSSVLEDSPGKNSGVDCPALLQRIFLTQGSNPGLLHCRQILYHLSHQGKGYELGFRQSEIKIPKGYVNLDSSKARPRHRLMCWLFIWEVYPREQE